MGRSRAPGLGSRCLLASVTTQTYIEFWYYVESAVCHALLFGFMFYTRQLLLSLGCVWCVGTPSGCANAVSKYRLVVLSTVCVVIAVLGKTMDSKRRKVELQPPFGCYAEGRQTLLVAACREALALVFQKRTALGKSLSFQLRWTEKTSSVRNAD